ncbi:MAG: hypothetical protein ACI8T1_001315 [Verrucomicrobiales bacterium]|jgi:hypothetical protein
MIGNSQNIAPERSAGLEVPVFAIPREGDLGCGDTQVVHELIDLAKEVGLGSLNLLPIQETVKGNDPFSPLSLFALDPILLDVSPWTLDDLQSVAYDRLTKDVSSSHGSESNALSYNKVKKLKLDLLWQAFEHFWKTHFLEGSSRARDYHRFCKREAAWLPDYSMYRMLMDFEQGRESWEDWSEDYGCYLDAKRFIATIGAKKPESVERQLAFYAYVQWVADDQWRNVRAHAKRVGIRLITDLHCAVSPHCSEFFRSPTSFRMEMKDGRQSAVCENDLLGHLEARLRRLSPFFDQFRISDFRKTIAHVEEDDKLKAFINSLPGLHTDPASMTVKVAWESLPSLAMQSTQLWPAPNGHLIPPGGSAQMSFSSFGTNSLRRLWAHDKLFRRRLKNQWAVNPKAYDLKTTLSLLRKLFQYPARHVQISYLDLAGLENEPSATWLARYDKGPRAIVEGPEWETFRDEFRKILQQTSRSPQSLELAVESK